MSSSRKPKFEPAAVTHKKMVFTDNEFIKRVRMLVEELNIGTNNQIHWIGFESDQIFYVGDNAVSGDTFKKIIKLSEDFAILIHDKRVINQPQN
jgi:hypothetical protein